MRRGLLGGTFNPVHIGHLCLADEARQVQELDKVTFIPNARPPHKETPEVTPERRYEMLLEATAGVSYFEISRVELERDGPSYTLDTLKAFPESEELVFICGADAFNVDWYKLDEVVERLDALVIAHRAGYASEIPDQLLALPASLHHKFSLMEFPAIGISSSDIRNRISKERAYRFLIPEPVYRIISTSGLYAQKKAH